MDNPAKKPSLVTYLVGFGKACTGMVVLTIAASLFGLDDVASRLPQGH